MANDLSLFVSPSRRVAAWLVHLFTASGAVFGLLSLYAIYRNEYLVAFWLMGGAIMVDSVDGVLARWAQVKVYAAKVDGALLDNILDYINYVLTPAFLALVSGMLPPGWGIVATSVIVLASAYQFTQPEAKTSDHFFKGFPSYWNIVVFYLFFWQLPPWVNLVILLVLAVLVFIPIKYVYPSRLDYLTHNRWLRRGMLLATVLWGVASIMLLIIYPATNFIWVAYSVAYVIFYASVSIYRTLVPLEPLSPPVKKDRLAEPLERLRKLRQRRWSLRLRRK